VIGRWTVLNIVLGLMVLLLGIQTARTWMRAVPPVRAPAPGPADPVARREGKAKPAPARGGGGDEQVALITSMDLFDPSRQAVGESGSTVAAVEVPPPQGIEVVGIRLIAGDQEAFIRDVNAQNAQRRVRTGDEVAGHTVQAINATNVELLNPSGQSVTLWLQLSPSAGAKPAAGGVAARPATPTSAGRSSAAVAAPKAAPLDPVQAQIQRRRERQQRIRQQRAPAPANRPPTVPGAVRQRVDQMQEKGT
jgi:hypothetical protein